MFLMPDNKWARLLAYVTGLVNQKLLLQNEYLAAENRILRAHLPARRRSVENRNGSKTVGMSLGHYRERLGDEGSG
jgi:hypothetical protein